MKLLPALLRPTFLLCAACVLTGVSVVRAQTTEISPPNKAPLLSGTFSGLSIAPTTNGKYVKLKALLTLLNSGNKAAKDVTATVYLSSDNTLDSGDFKVTTLDLATFFDGDGNIGKGKSVNVPLKYKAPALLASSLNGQYVIIVLAAADQSVETTSTPIVIGPLSVQ